MIKSAEISRRDALKSGVSLGAVAFTASTLPWLAMAQGEELVPFSDVPESWAPGPRRPGSGHIINTRNLVGAHES